MKSILVRKDEKTEQLIALVASMRNGGIHTREMLQIECANEEIADALGLLLNVKVEEPTGPDLQKEEPPAPPVTTGTCKFCGGPTVSSRSTVCASEECTNKQKKEWNDAYQRRKREAEQSSDPFGERANAIQ